MKKYYLQSAALYYSILWEKFNFQETILDFKQGGVIEQDNIISR
jgi:hypothetical protein